MEDLERDLALIASAHDAVGRVVIGQDEAIRQLFVSVLSRGHALIEGAPGLGKTLLVRSMAKVLGLEFSRVQFTPDLMPADITGSIVLVYDEQGRARPRFQPGPIFGQLVLADEVNRATPKTQSALLEAMQEGTVTVLGTEHRLDSPFIVLATQNPLEMEGTYVLPEAQVDRFQLKVNIGYPDDDKLRGILSQTTQVTALEPTTVLRAADVLRLQRHVRNVPAGSAVVSFIVRLIRSTIGGGGTSTAKVASSLRFGVSPRGGQALLLGAKANALLEGRFNASLDDVEKMLLPALRHRISLTYDAIADGMTVDRLLRELYASTPKD